MIFACLYKGLSAKEITHRLDGWVLSKGYTTEADGKAVEVPEDRVTNFINEAIGHFIEGKVETLDDRELMYTLHNTKEINDFINDARLSREMLITLELENVQPLEPDVLSIWKITFTIPEVIAYRYITGTFSSYGSILDLFIKYFGNYLENIERTTIKMEENKVYREAKESEFDNITKPSHYCEGRKYQPMDVISDWDLNFNLGCVIKYIARAGRKGSALEDLQKAQRYLVHEINKLWEVEKKGERSKWKE